MGKSKLEAVVFDLDGVITDTAYYHYLAWKRLANQLNIQFDEAFNENLKGVSRVQSLELILKKGNRQNDFSPQEIERLAGEKNKLYKQFIRQLTPDAILPGIKKLLDEIKLDDLPIGLASASKNAITVLEELELVEPFDYCADASKVKHSKPDPEIFLTVCENLQVNPSNVVGVEDAVVGIEAIQAGGMFAVGVGENLTKANIIVPDTSYLCWENIKTSFYSTNQY